MPDPPIMPNTASVMSSPQCSGGGWPLDRLDYITRPYSTNVLWPQRPVTTSSFSQGKADVHHQRPAQTPVDHRALPGHEPARYQPGHLRQYQPAPRRRDADYADERAL